MELPAEDLADLRRAKDLLETLSLAARIAGVVGTPIERLLKGLPKGATEIVTAAVDRSLTSALRVALSTLSDRYRPPANRLHKAVVATTGAAGGAFGLAALPLELSASTIVMLRSIADIARSEGEAIHSPEAKLACIEVFALGGPSSRDDAAESAYFAVRAALAKTLAEAAEHLAQRGAAQQGAPALVRFIAQVAARFGVPVSQKAMAQSVPVIGAAGGAAINLLFIDHFQDLARGHFIVRRLERQHGPETIRKAYLAV
jgi:hypothetical protein